MTEARTNRFETKYTDTYFAPAGRASESDLQESVEKLTQNPILDAMMEVLGSWVLAVNQQRQILAINAKLIEELGIENPARFLGLRPGEALGCKYAFKGPDGCGTGQACSTCGAAIAMVTAQENGVANDQTCVLTTVKGNATHDSVFSVRCVPVNLAEEDILLVCMHDISTEQRRKALERTYLHDISNILSAMSASIERLRPDASEEQLELIDTLKECSRTLIREIRIQRLFCTNGGQGIEVNSSEIWPEDVLKRIRALIRNHPAAHMRKISVDEKSSIAPAMSDMTLVTRILVNMIINALEACQDGDEVKVGFNEGTEITFWVWNKQRIPENVAPRIFQRYFSTKTGSGRGTGTFSMKLLGESLLKGKVDFESSADAGTTFRFSLPVHPSYRNKR